MAATDTTIPITITIISDNVCPFCYLGRKRLDRALELFRKTVPGARATPISIDWQAHLLDDGNRNLPTCATPMTELVEKKFGADRAIVRQEKMARMAAMEGIHLTFQGRLGPTRDSHRLIALGKTKGWEVADRLVMEIMHMFFEEGGDITSYQDLACAAEKVGIDINEAKEWLETGQGGAEIDEEVARNVASGIHGVPKFIVNGKYEVDGAEDVYGFLEALCKAKEENQNAH